MNALRPLHHFVPLPGRIAGIEVESDDTRTFVIRLIAPGAAFASVQPGQFVMLSILGHGEAPFTLSRLPGIGPLSDSIAVTVRRVGRLTTAFFALREGAMIGVRGPLGHGFPIESYERPAVYIGGGCGLSPLKAAIDAHIAARPIGTRVGILYGARDESTRIHRRALAEWARMPHVSVIECLQNPDGGWHGPVGLISDFVAEAVASCGAQRAAICGPPAMLQVVARRVCACGVPAADVHVAVERYMKCGTGHCGHCYINHRYACTDGPVFSYAELQRLPDAFV